MSGRISWFPVCLAFVFLALALGLAGCGNNTNSGSGTGFEPRPMGDNAISTMGTYSSSVIAETDPIVVKASIHGFTYKEEAAETQGFTPRVSGAGVAEESAVASPSTGLTASPSPHPLQVGLNPSGGVSASLTAGSAPAASGTAASTAGGTSATPAAPAAPATEPEVLPRGTESITINVVYADGKSTDQLELKADALKSLPAAATVEKLAKGDATLQVRALDGKGKVLAAGRYPLHLWPGRTYEVSVFLGVLVNQKGMVPEALEVPVRAGFFVSSTDGLSHDLVWNSPAAGTRTWSISPKQGARIAITQGGEWTLSCRDNSHTEIVKLDVTGAPVLSGIFPPAGVAGSKVMLKGAGLGLAQGPVKVLFGDKEATVSSWSRAQVLCEVPEGLPKGPVEVRFSPSESPPLTFKVESGGEESHSEAAPGKSE